MTKETHSTGGVCIGLLTLNYLITEFLTPYNLAYKILLVALFFHFSYIGALFPDIDQRKSSISQMYPFLSKHFGSKCRHRGFTHSLLCVAIICSIFYTILYISDGNIILFSISFGFICGYISHLALDFITSEGIELLFPWKANFKIAKIKTGSKIEKFINKIIKIINIILVAYNIYLISYSVFGITLFKDLLN
ncbi:metal-dependent hydrolase [Clostridium sp. B9]|uniref:metal-dependent hydrolase n=1 Tax=Clostridium sp. B9 TaxID=3423224 RepID=UPI003D2ED278